MLSGAQAGAWAPESIVLSVREPSAEENIALG